MIYFEITLKYKCIVIDVYIFDILNSYYIICLLKDYQNLLMDENSWNWDGLRNWKLQQMDSIVIWFLHVCKNMLTCNYFITVTLFYNSDSVEV